MLSAVVMLMAELLPEVPLKGRILPAAKREEEADEEEEEGTGTAPVDGTAKGENSSSSESSAAELAAFLYVCASL